MPDVDADPYVEIWTSVLRQVTNWSVGRDLPRGTHTPEARVRRQQEARAWIFEPDGPAARQRQLVLSVLGVDEAAFQERVRRLMGEAAEDEPPRRMSCSG